MLAALDPQTAETLVYDWGLTARDKQLLPEGRWRTWLILAGRGFGKTRTGAETIREWAEGGVYRRLALVGRSASDVRDTMIEGESGLLAHSPPWFRPRYLPSKRRLIWPNGVIATTYSADKPDQLRGPQHDAAWADELAAWRYPDAWDQLQLGLRLGSDPRVVVTTTPRPTPLIRDLIKRHSTRLTRGTTYENRENVAADWLSDILDKYENTRLGRQELDAEVLDDTPGALWSREQLERLRVKFAPPAFLRRVVGIDPAVSTKTGSAETGIMGVGAARCDCKGASKIETHLFVLEDRSGRWQPLEWATRGIDLYRELRADRVLGEKNNGGDLVQQNLATVDPSVPFGEVWASEGKRTRAEPISALYEQGRVHHVGMFAELEDQQCTWAALTSGERSPDRVDALVHACTELLPLVRAGATSGGGFTFSVGTQRRI